MKNKSKREGARVSIEEVKQRLESRALDFQQLADHLTTKSGQPLDSWEKQLIVQAYVPEVQERLDMVGALMILNRTEGAIDDLSYTQKLLKDLHRFVGTGG